MRTKSVLDKSTRFIFNKLCKINDSAQKIALGVSLGVFAGLLPAAGPLAALFLAFIFRANRAAALLGSLLTNTWLSLLTFILAIKVGSAILKVDWLTAKEQILLLFKNFSWSGIFKLPFLEVLLPVLLGYLVVGCLVSVLSYFSARLVLSRYFRKKGE